MMKLHAHPFSSYCQKALIWFYETGTPFEFVMLEGEQSMADLAALWPLKQFPLLVDGDTVVPEATAIIEYLEAVHSGSPRLIPSDPIAAAEVRMMDRVFDNYVSNPQASRVFNILRPEADRDPLCDGKANATLDTIYAWLDQRLAGKTWATDHGFSLADCAAAPALFYADWTHRIPENLTHLHAYRARLLAHPSIARAVDGGRPYRDYFPLGAPDRD